MAARVVCFGHDVEEERFHVVIQSLVVQEEFRQQTQVLTVNLGEKNITDIIFYIYINPVCGQRS